MSTDYIARFEKVSFDQYIKDVAKINGINKVNEENKNHIFDIWKNIKLPQRATFGAAGYDFYMPSTTFAQEASCLIPTGIRAKIEDGWVLMLFPRSGYGIKYGMALDNTVGVIDSDYYFADNEGHIMAKIHADKPFLIDQGDRFIQGVFLPFGVSINGNSMNRRVGGLGSTGAK